MLNLLVIATLNTNIFINNQYWLKSHLLQKIL